MVTFTLLMGLLQLCKVNVLKVVVLAGTFALALAFAGNDLVNFIGVPLAGFSAYTDYDSTQLLTDIQSDLDQEVVKQLVTDIFQAAAANW